MVLSEFISADKKLESAVDKRSADNFHREIQKWDPNCRLSLLTIEKELHGFSEACLKKKRVSSGMIYLIQWNNILKETEKYD